MTSRYGRLDVMGKCVVESVKVEEEAIIEATTECSPSSEFVSCLEKRLQVPPNLPKLFPDCASFNPKLYKINDNFRDSRHKILKRFTQPVINNITSVIGDFNNRASWIKVKRRVNQAGINIERKIIGCLHT